MLDLLACLTERVIEVPHVGRFHVRPPSLEEALRAMAALEACQRGDPEGWPALESACRAWLPGAMADAYFGEDTYPPAVQEDVRGLLEVGVEDKVRHAADRKKVEETAAARTWFAVLADYADALNTSPVDALRAPFPLFIALCAEVYRLQERRKADWMLAYTVAKSGSEESWRQIMKAAGYGAEEPAGPAQPGPEWQDPAWVAAQKEKIQNYHARQRARRFGIEPGEA